MGIDVTIRIRKREKCPHCGTFVPGDVIDEMEAGGGEFKHIIKVLDYHYDGFKLLNKEQSDYLIEELIRENYNDYASRCIKAKNEGDYIAFDAW